MPTGGCPTALRQYTALPRAIHPPIAIFPKPFPQTRPFAQLQLALARSFVIKGADEVKGGHVRLNKSVVLVGMMGAGKTAVGTQLARKLGAPFLDSDEEIVQAAGASIAEIFDRDGEAFFRARESEVIARLLRGTPAVLSTGGGAFLAAGNRQMIHDLGLSVWLKVDLEILWQRVRHKNTRPLLRTPNPRETLAQLLAARLPAYAQADITVEGAADITPEEMADRVIAALAPRPDVIAA